MAARKVPLVSGEYYHIYNRGNSKQVIFHDKSDYEHFVKLLYLCNTRKNINFRDMIVDPKIDVWDFHTGNPLVSIGAWVLMPNHFHLYLKYRDPEVELRGNISEFMRKISTAYAKYFNAKYERTGSLFEGTFKSIHIDNDVQAKYLFSYMHLNPVKIFDAKWKAEGIYDRVALEKFLDGYLWSSYCDHKGVVRPENCIISITNFPRYFLTPNAIREEIFSWIAAPRSQTSGK